MKREWFAAWGWVFRPIAWPGWLFTVLALPFCGQVFAAIDRHSHSATDTLFGVFPYVVPTLLVLERIAAKTCRR